MPNITELLLKALRSPSLRTGEGMLHTPPPLRTAPPDPPNLGSFRQFNDAQNRGNWNFLPIGEREGWGGSSLHRSYSVEPNDIPPNWAKFKDYRGRTTHYDPEHAEQYSETIGEEPEKFTLNGARLKPDVVHDFPTAAEPGTIYRGMSWDEFQNGLRTGEFRSRGDYNLGDEQKGLTFYSSRPEQAQNYAHGFAPWAYKGTPSRPATVLGVRDPGKYGQVVGETELGLRGSVPLEDVRSVHVGRPAIVRPGDQEFYSEYGRPWTTGSGSSPSITPVWSNLVKELMQK